MTSSPSSSPGRRATLAERLLLPATALSFAAAGVATDREHDLFWMAREGQDLWNGGGFIHADRWSWAPVDAQFTPTSPGWQLLLGGAWSAAGRAGLILLALLTLIACAGAVAWLAHLAGASPTGTAFAFVPGLALGGSAWSARAALPSLILFMTAIGTLWAIRDRLARATTWRAAGLVGVAAFGFASAGIWLHNSWAAYAFALPAALVVMSTGGTFGSPSRAVTVVVAALLGTFIGAATGPLGLAAWDNASTVATTCRGLVVEWSTPWQAGTANFLTWLAVVLVVSALLPSLRRRDNTWPLRAVFILGALASALAGTYALRFSLTSSVLLLPALAAELSRGPSPRARGRLQALGPRLHEPYWRTVACLLVALLLPISLIALPKAYDRLEDPVLQAIPRGCRTFTDDAAGSVLALARPDTSAWMDGRLDYWGRARMLQLFAVERGQGQPLLPDGTACVLLAPGEAIGLARALADSQQWRVAAKSNAWTLWRRD